MNSNLMSASGDGCELDTGVSLLSFRLVFWIEDSIVGDAGFSMGRVNALTRAIARVAPEG